ncbi:MAG: hypothetical protein IKK85_08685 [Clostridia bacterium]|nr:hypothetical protein [Clostridia bacterium]
MKNRLFKNVICIMLTVLLAFGTTATAFAQDEIILPEETTTEQPPTQEPTIPEEPTEPADPEEDVTDENEIVAKVSLFSAMYVFPVSSHCWIYVENLTDSPMTVGIYEVPVGQGVSVGVFSFSVNDGWGIYYNLEAFRENRNDNIDGCWSITLDFTRSELEELSSSIKNYPNMWEMFIFNCTFFALSMWNHNTNYFLLPFFIPALPWLEVIIAGGKKGEAQMYYPTSDQVFRQRGTGNSAYLEPVGEKTLSK